MLGFCGSPPEVFFGSLSESASDHFVESRDCDRFRYGIKYSLCSLKQTGLGRADALPRRPSSLLVGSLRLGLSSFSCFWTGLISAFISLTLSSAGMVDWRRRRHETALSFSPLL